MTESHIEELGPSRLAEASEVLCDAFHDYPLMRFVLRDSTYRYDSHLRMLNDFFVMARALRGEPILGILDGKIVVAVGLLALPDEGAAPERLSDLWTKTWSALGSRARAYYESVRRAREPFFTESCHIHLDMLGVRGSHQGRGLGSRVLQHTHSLSRQLASSRGVSLTTESARNVRMYERFGYRVVGHAEVAPELQTWGLLRRDQDHVGG